MLGLARLGLLVLHVMLCLYSVKLSLSMMELAARSTEKPINKPLERHIMTSAVAKKISASLVMMKSISQHNQAPVLRPWSQPRLFLIGLFGACVEECFMCCLTI